MKAPPPLLYAHITESSLSSDTRTHQMFPKALGKNPQVCACARVFMSASHNWLFLRICWDLWPPFFLQRRFLFWNPIGAKDQGSEGEAGSSAQNRWLRLTLLSNPLTLTSFFIYRRFTRNPSASHINALANNWGLLVWPAGVKRTTWSNEIKLAERKSLLLIIEEKGFLLYSIMMEGMQKGDIEDSAELFGCE